jgi:hypothetical protein
MVDDESSMKNHSSRRDFLAAGLALPVAATVPAGPSMNSSLQAASALRYRTLGRTGLKVSAVGYGCMITSDPSVITRAADLGINFFDTSRRYQQGNNERMVGAALKGKRNHVILSSKTDGSTKEEALAELETSLKELGTDHLDIWHLHSKSSPESITDELVDALETAKKQGKTRFVGVSTHRLAAIAAAVVKGGKLDVIQATYNFTVDADMAAAVESLHQAGVGLVAMKVMAGGTRGRKTRPEMQRPGALTAALKWVLKNPNIGTTVPSMTDMDQLDQNFKAMTETFSDADQKILTAWLDEIRPLYCRMCGQCDGKCPQGLPVSDVLRYLMYAEDYGQFPLGREKFLELPTELTRVRCRLCPSCTIQCPNGVRVAERLIRAQELFA